jgi:hypothetical protein
MKKIQRLLLWSYGVAVRRQHKATGRRCHSFWVSVSALIGGYYESRGQSRR